MRRCRHHGALASNSPELESERWRAETMVRSGVPGSALAADLRVNLDDQGACTSVAASIRQNGQSNRQRRPPPPNHGIRRMTDTCAALASTYDLEVVCDGASSSVRIELDLVAHSLGAGYTLSWARLADCVPRTRVTMAGTVLNRSDASPDLDLLRASPSWDAVPFVVSSIGLGPSWSVAVAPWLDGRGPVLCAERFPDRHWVLNR